MTSLLLSALLLQQKTEIREWRRHPAPGIEYRMIVQASPKLMAVALRFAPDSPYRAVATQARDQVYDLSPNNGRATLTEIVTRTGAIGGVNGDFFQWGKDPGGDPVNVMVRNGELLSTPAAESPGGRSLAWGWGGGKFSFGRSSWKASASLGGQITAFNAYTPAKGLALSTASAGYAISKTAATFIVLNVGPKVVTPRCTLDGTVTQVVEGVEKLRVNPGTVVLSSQDGREALRAAKIGQKVKIQVAVDGFDWKRVDQVMGGGPELVRNGLNVAPKEGDFNTDRHPRTVVGRDKEGGVWFIAIDGRQNHSVGTSLPETAELCRYFGLVDAMNLDGGGSTTMNLFGDTLNRPSGGVERAVGNAVVLFGPRPAMASIPMRIVVDAKNHLSLVDEANRAYAPDRIIWSAQGKAWVDGDGLLHPLETGETTVRALVDGMVFEAKVSLKGSGKAATDDD